MSKFRGGGGFGVEYICERLKIQVDKKRHHTAEYDTGLESTLLSKLIPVGTSFADSALRRVMHKHTRKTCDRVKSYSGVDPKRPLSLRDSGLLHLAGMQYVEKVDVMKEELLINHIHDLIVVEGGLFGQGHRIPTGYGESNVQNDTGNYEHIADLEKFSLASENRELKTTLERVSADLAYECRQNTIFRTMAGFQAGRIAELEARLEESQRRSTQSEIEYYDLVRAIQADNQR